MPTKILKSQIQEVDFDAAVKAHIGELIAWRAHMANVGKDPKKYQTYPQPQAHPLVESSILEVEGSEGANYTADYEIVNDDPSPELLLRQKKNALLQHVSQLETVASLSVVPAGKKRFLNMRENDIRTADAGRKASILKEHADRQMAALKKLPEQKRLDPVAVTEAIGEQMTDELLDKHVEKARSDEENDFLAEQAVRQARYDAISRHGALLHYEIEDLTLDNIEQWVMKPFPA